jgi:hypothetical protein
MSEISVSGLYYRYKKTEDKDIQEHLSHIKIVRLQNKGAGTLHGYYPLNEESIKKIAEKPRNVSLTFDATETSDTPIEGLVEYKTITYLVKSSSRFFLKPDVGEIFDQIHFRDLLRDEIKAICYLDGYESLPDTDGEHFLMKAMLLTDKKQ